MNLVREKISDHPSFAPQNYKKLGQWVKCCKRCIEESKKPEVIQRGTTQSRKTGIKYDEIHTGGKEECKLRAYDENDKLIQESDLYDFKCGSGKPPNEIEGIYAETCKACGSKNVLCIYYELYVVPLVETTEYYELECLNCKKYTAYTYLS